RDPVVVEQRVIDVEEVDGRGHPRNGVCAPLDRMVARWKREGRLAACAWGTSADQPRVADTSIRKAAMNITKDQLTKEVGVARNNGWLPVFTKAEKRHNLPPGLLLAIASRETDMQDIVGDAGHGRGLFQIDDRSHGDFL